VFEGAAIALYLTDKFPKAKMGPLAGQPKRGEYLTWLAYRPGVMEPAFICKRFEVKHVYGAMGWAPVEEVEEVLNRHLEKRPYFLGDDFSAVDIMVGGGIYFMMMAKLLKETQTLKDYAARITARPAYVRMMERDKNTPRAT
jgi:glutathione S-transferase